MIDLQLYLDRIGFSGLVKPDLATFRAIHRAHALSLVYENLDVQFKTPVTRSPAAAFDKIVVRRRGGWCYEMNGLLGAALEEAGFAVTRLAGAVMRDIKGDQVIGNHLVLLVTIDGESWIGDVGFGDGLIDPVRLAEGSIAGNPLDCRIECLSGGWWRYVNDTRTGGPSFDFNPGISDETLLEARCEFLQRDPASPFVQNAVAQRWSGDVHLSLRGRVLRTLSSTNDERRLINSADEYVETLRTVFTIDLPEAGKLWPAICRRHDEIFKDRPAT